MDITIVFDDGTSLNFKVYEIVIRDGTAVITTRDNQVIIKEDESDQKW